MKLRVVNSSNGRYLYFWPGRVSGDLYIISRYGFRRVEGHNDPALFPTFLAAVIAFTIAAVTLIGQLL